MRHSALPWIILATVALAAALAWLTLTRGGIGGNRAAVTDHNVLPPFHELEIGGAAEVLIVQGPAEALDVDDVGHATVQATISNGRLLIRALDRRRWWNRLFGHEASRAPTITVHLRTLDRLVLSGTVKVTAPRMQTPSLQIGASGGASLTIDDLVATTLRVDGSGALSAEIGGRVGAQHVSISGAGSYNAERLKALDATVFVSGVGSVVINAERTLNASISGAGVIEYIGDPKVTEHVSGMGRVRRHETSAPGMRVAVAYCSRVEDVASASLNINGPPVTGSTSGWIPPSIRTFATRQSRSSPVSIATTSFTASYG